MNFLRLVRGANQSQVFDELLKEKYKNDYFYKILAILFTPV
jgi:hypothetical protein